MLSIKDIQSSKAGVDSFKKSIGGNQLRFDIEIELNNLEQIICNGTNIPFTKVTIIERSLLLNKLKQIKANLPIDFTTAIEIANHKQQIISEAERYSAALIRSATEKANQMLQDSAIIRQAELDGAKLRFKTERECEELRQAMEQELALLRQNALAEYLTIQNDAENYADNVLVDIEHKLQDMLAIIKNGRQQLTEPR